MVCPHEQKLPPRVSPLPLPPYPSSSGFILHLAVLTRDRGASPHLLDSLIILLIQSDTLKSIVFIILPIIEIARGPVASGGATCQISGFFLTVGFEACDIAVLLLALHTALYIFRGRGGLYPYRHGAFAVFLAVPLLLASLAFINKPAFTNSGRYCHLPSKPRWASLALSWIPRYLILVTICVTYVSTYVYVQILMNRFGAACGGDRPPASLTPPIADHGLLPPTPPPVEGSTPPAESGDESPAASMAADGHTMAHRGRSGDHDDQRALVQGPLVDASCTKETTRPDADPSHPVYQQERCALSNLEMATPASRQMVAKTAPPGARLTLSEPPARYAQSKSGWPWTQLASRTSPRNSWNRPLLATAPAQISRPPMETCSPTPTPPSRLRTVFRRGTGSPDSTARVGCQRVATLGTPPGMTKMRDKIRRQLGQLFIYPAVYIVVWLIPFVSQTADSASLNRPSFGLAVASLASLCVQGVADALVFSLLEKPWRYPRRVTSDHGVLLWWWSIGGGGRGRGQGAGRSGSSSFMPCWPVLSTVDGHPSSGAGRTRDEMLMDSRAARLRRDDELAERRMLRRTEPGSAETRPREWWDVHLGNLDSWDNDDVGCSAKGSRATVVSHLKGVGRGFMARATLDKRPEGPSTP